MRLRRRSIQGRQRVTWEPVQEVIGKPWDNAYLWPPQARGAVKLLGGKIENSVSFELPKTEGERTLVVIRKVEATAKKYPRKAGMPGKEPLK